MTDETNSESTTLVGSSPSLRGEDVPDYEALAARVRPLYDRIHRREITGRRERLEALAATRDFLWEARAHRADFLRISRSRLRLTGRGRLETVAIKWFWRSDAEGDTTFKRMADVLAWMADRLPRDMTDEDVITATIAAGGFIKVSKLYPEPKLRPEPTPIDLLGCADAILEDCLPMTTGSVFERGSANEVNIVVLRARPNCLPELYGPAQITDKLTMEVLKGLRGARR